MTRTAFALAFALAFGTAHAKTPFDETRPLNPDARVSLDNLKGRIEVTTWDRAQIRIEGERGEGTTGLSISGDAARLQVKIEYPESGGGWFGLGGGRAGPSQLRVSVPVGVSLDVDSVAADIEVRGVAGAELSIESVSGEVVADTGAADVEIETVSGDLLLTARSTDVVVESVSGDVKVGGEISGRISLEAVSGNLRFDSPAPVRHLEAGVVSGDVTLHAALQPGGRISAESLSGDLELVLPAGSSARLEASSFNGTIRSDAGEVKTEEYGPGSRLKTALGSGDGRIELETFSGDLTVRSR